MVIMPSTLVPCVSCKRHVRESEVRCPFCGAEVAPAARPARPAPVTSGSSRARLYAARAAVLASSAALACGGGDSDEDPEAGGSAGMTAMSGGSGGVATGSGGVATGGTSQGGFGGPTGGFLAMPYGCVWPADEEV
jgi:hypothetical protein